MVRSIPSLGFDIPSFEIHHSKPWTKIVDSAGYPILKEEKGRNKGYQYTTLDELLRCPVFGEDVSFYLRATLTSPKGLNIRNKLCHGLVSPNTFNVQIADRLIHILVLLIVLNSKQIICN